MSGCQVPGLKEKVDHKGTGEFWWAVELFYILIVVVVT